MTATTLTELSVQAADGSTEAYLARPVPGSEDLPGVLLIIDAIGLRPRIAEMAQRIASWGYVVLAPNVLYRSGSAAETRPAGALDSDRARQEFFAHAGPRLRLLFASDVLGDLRSYVQALHAQPGVSPGPIGVTGYCMGARLATRLAGELGEGVAAVGGFHGGGLVTDAADSPHLSLPGATAEFVYGHAEGDPSNPPAAIAALGEALAAAGLTASNEVYPGTSHGFTMSDTAVYHPEGAERHFRELRELFARRLG